MAHTPGPWIAAAKPSSVVGWPVVQAGVGRVICNVSFRPPYGEDEFNAESADNARAIAALPDAFDALKQADSAINPPDREGINLVEWDRRLKAATAAIRAALRKAGVE